MYAVHLRLIGKLVGDFLLVIIELFFARCFRFVTIHAFDRQADVDSKVRSNEVRCAQKNVRNILLTELSGSKMTNSRSYCAVMYILERINRNVIKCPMQRRQHLLSCCGRTTLVAHPRLCAGLYSPNPIDQSQPLHTRPPPSLFAEILCHSPYTVRFWCYEVMPVGYSLD